MTSPTSDSRPGRAREAGKPGSHSLVERILRPFEEFAAIEASGGLVLLGGMTAALIMANSPWAGGFAAFWKTELGLSPAWLGLSRPLSFWINDGLMTIFFLVMGLEIKRQLLAGQLASPRRAALPLVAAAGGMLVPALLYLSLNLGTPAARGWGIPTATDIAVTIGLMALLGSRVPLGLKVFVTALAIADDIGAVLVIALFYSHSLAWLQLAAAAVVLVLLALANRLGVRSPWVFGLLGLGLWVSLLESGIHTTIAGVLLAAAVPARTRIDAVEFLTHSRSVLARFARASRDTTGPLASPDQLEALHRLEDACERAATPLQRMERHLHPWVTFGIMPLFALANSGVSFAEVASGLDSPRVALGVTFGLVLGKPIGILVASWLAVRLGLAAKPEAVSWAQMLGAGFLCGIGFTMSLFIANLAFGSSGSLASAKLGILLASAAAGLLGALHLARRSVRS
jgi:Na+:H+ antiporter, NhaA family